MAHPLNPGCWELQTRRSQNGKWTCHSRDNDKPMMDLRFAWWCQHHTKPGVTCRLFALDTAATDATFTQPGELAAETIDTNELDT